MAARDKLGHQHVSDTAVQLLLTYFSSVYQG